MTLRKKIGRNKYGNIRTLADGFLFDSKRESKRWLDLCILLRAGQIKNLKRQVIFPLIVNGELLCKYKADFVYEDHGKRIVEDVKGVKTDIYRLKKKMMKTILGIEILET